MKNYSIEERSVFDKSYLSIDFGDLDMLEVIQQEISQLECVKRANISVGKRKHITVYVQKFIDIKDAYNTIKTFLDAFEAPSGLKTVVPVTSTEQTKMPAAKIQLSEAPLNPIETSNTDIKGQLDTIPNDAPVVFISYAWDDDAHKQWVRHLSDELRSTYGIDTLLDQYNRAGLSLPEFMVRGIKKAKRVLVIGSPRYKEKLDAGDPNGAVFEDQIMTIEIYNGCKGKFIPVLARGSFKTSFSELMGVNIGYDFSTEEKYNEQIEGLAAELWDEPLNQPPTLGSKPVFGNKRVVCKPEVKPAVSLQQHLQNAFDPYKGEKWLKRLLEAFSFNLMDNYFHHMPERFNMKIATSFDMWEAGIKTTTFKIKNPDTQSVVLDFFDTWRTITNIGLVHYGPSNNGIDYHFEGYIADVCLNPEDDRDFHQIMDLIPVLYQKYKAMADHIKNTYPEVDLEETSIAFEQTYK